jgi:hypothetical protein
MNIIYIYIIYKLGESSNSHIVLKNNICENIFYSMENPGTQVRFQFWVPDHLTGTRPSPKNPTGIETGG